MANNKRFELTEIQKARPVVTISPSGSDFLLKIEILIKGKNSPIVNPGDPEEDTHRDIDIDSANLFIGDHKVIMAAAHGTKDPLLTFKALIAGKIPGTSPEFKVRKK